MTQQGHRRPPLIVIPIVIVLALAGWWGYTTWRTAQTESQGGLVASGTVEAQESQVTSILSGRIVGVEAEEGSDVAKGATLFTLDDELLKLQVDQARAALTAARAALKQAKDDDASDAEIAAARARVVQARAAVRMARTQASYAVIAAPASGVITGLSAHVGENASPGKALATIADLSQMHVSIFVPETQIGRVKIGQTARLAADGTTEAFSGKVTFIASEAEFTPNNIETKDQRTQLVYEVRVSIDDAKDFLKPGMPVDVVLVEAGSGAGS